MTQTKHPQQVKPLPKGAKHHLYAIPVYGKLRTLWGAAYGLWIAYPSHPLENRTGTRKWSVGHRSSLRLIQTNLTKGKAIKIAQQLDAAFPVGSPAQTENGEDLNPLRSELLKAIQGT